MLPTLTLSPAVGGSGAQEVQTQTSGEFTCEWWHFLNLQYLSSIAFYWCDVLSFQFMSTQSAFFFTLQTTSRTHVLEKPAVSGMHHTMRQLMKAHWVAALHFHSLSFTENNTPNLTQTIMGTNVDCNCCISSILRRWVKTGTFLKALQLCLIMSQSKDKIYCCYKNRTGGIIRALPFPRRWTGLCIGNRQSKQTAAGLPAVQQRQSRRGQ